MGVELTVPTLGESITEAVVGKWNKKAGDAVKVDEPLVVLETDKVTVDVPAPAGGTLESVRFKEGDKVKVGEEEMTVYHTPGHTPGGMCLIGDGFAFTGDTLFVDSIGRVDFPGGSETRMMASLQRLQGLLKRDMMLYPGHGEPGTFGRALLVNPFLGNVY
jgi:glyoxylase-like metal-dependent hydrolase (beta-lactamase superfamily II)